MQLDIYTANQGIGNPGLNAVQKKEMGDAVESTTFRDARMAELDNWMADFIGIAHIALQDNPDSVKKLGL